MRADQLIGRGALEKIERERTDLAERIGLHVVGDPHAAPGQKITAAVAEQAAEDDGHRNEKQAAENPLPIERLALDRKPGIDQDIELLLEDFFLRLERVDRGAFALLLLRLLDEALLRHLLDMRRIVEPIEDDVDAPQRDAVGKAEENPQHNAGDEAWPITGQIRPGKLRGLKKGMHQLTANRSHLRRLGQVSPPHRQL